MPRASIWVKLFVLLLAVSIIPAGITVYWGYRNARVLLENGALSHLSSIRDIKRKQIINYFLDCLSDTKVLAKEPTFIQHLKSISNTTLIDKSDMEIAESSDHFIKHLDFIKHFNKVAGNTVKEEGFYDIFIIDTKGNVLHTYKKEDDLGTNLLHGKYKNTSLAKVFRKGLKEPVISDIEFYEPSQEKISAFFAAPVKDESGEVLGVLAAQITMKEIDEIMHERSGLGKTGETYLIGPDFLLRSDSRFFEEKTVLKLKINQEAPKRAIAGKTGTMWLPDYRDIPVLNAYTPLNMPGLNWALIAKIDEEEVLAPIFNLRKQVLFGSLVLTVLILFISYFFSKRIALPLIALDKKLLKMSDRGKYGDTLRVPSNDEIGSLVASFNKMSTTLKTQTTSLEKANKEMVSFLYSVSHDLKVPIITVQGMINLIQKELGDDMSENAKTYVSHINDSVFMMNQLLQDLLEISRVGRMDVEPETVNIAEIAEQVTAEAKIFAKEREFDFRVQPDIPRVNINRKRLYQILSNLVVNSVKFMPKSVRKPFIEIGYSKKDHGFLECYVKDNGEGIDSRNQERIFTLFERLHGHEVSGTGMGLAYVKKIVETTGGAVRVESSVGKGSTFYFTIPALTESTKSGFNTRGPKKHFWFQKTMQSQ